MASIHKTVLQSEPGKINIGRGGKTKRQSSPGNSTDHGANNQGQLQEHLHLANSSIENVDPII